MGLSTGMILQPARGVARPRGIVGAADLARWVSAVVTGGAGLGVLWWLLAPTARTQIVDGGVFLTGNLELQIAQDGWLAAVLAVTGTLLAAVQSLRAREAPVRRALVGMVSLVVCAVVAWQVGQLLGPDPLAEQLARGLRHPVTPLALHTPAVLLVGPMLFCFTRCLAALLTTEPAPRY
jgi:hypothetical protein